MAITIRHSTNAALQYNQENDMAAYAMLNTGTNYPFLTQAPNPRPLNINEKAFLYFISGETSLNAAIYRAYYDLSGMLLSDTYEDMSGVGIHNSIPVNVDEAPLETSRMCITLVRNLNLFLNGNFSTGSGNLFTNWTLTQPSRTNLYERSNAFTTAPWSGAYTATVTSSTDTDPFGGSTGWVFTDGNAGDTLFFGGQSVAQTATQAYVMCFYIRKTVGLTHYPGIDISSIGGSGENVRLLINTQTGAINSALSTGATIIGSGAFLEDNDYYRIWVKFSFPTGTTMITYFYPAMSTNGTSVQASATGSTGYYGAQIGPDAIPTPYIPTTSASVTTSLGEYLSSATGGPDGSRALKAWAGTGTATKYGQSVALTNGVSYRISLTAKNFRAVTDGAINVYVAGVLKGTIDLTDSYDTYSIDFTSGSTSSQAIEFIYVNDPTYGFAIIDDMVIRSLVNDDISETRCFDLVGSCRGLEVVWLNKLGGYDSFYFTGFPVEGKEVQRQNDIKYPMQTHFASPDRTYAAREIKSGKTLGLFTRCTRRDVAKWIKFELIDSIDVYVIPEDVYLPVNVLNNSVADVPYVNNFDVNFAFRYAFDVNGQRR